MARKPPTRKSRRPAKGRGRPSSKARKPKRRVASRSKGKKARTRQRAKAVTPLRRAARWTAKWSAVVGLGAALGSAVVVSVQYRQAVQDVDELLGGRVWSSSGRVMSAPLSRPRRSKLWGLIHQTLAHQTLAHQTLHATL